jgi:hypothetical protein
VRGIGLAEQMVQVERGALTGLVLAPSVDPNGGPNVARVRIEGPGSARSLGQTELGNGQRGHPGAHRPAALIAHRLAMSSWRAWATSSWRAFAMSSWRPLRLARVRHVIVAPAKAGARSPCLRGAR